MILQLITKLQTYPVVISMQDEAVSVTNIDFPAVTLCPSLNINIDGFDYEAIAEYLRNEESQFGNLSIETYVKKNIISNLKICRSQ